MSRHKGMGFDKITYDDIIRISHSGHKIHFVGIGGVSMYSLARLANNLGATVSGSDRESSPRTDILSSLGMEIFIGHRSENLSDAGLVVYSHAIDEDNPELIYAREHNIPTVSRAEYLGAMMLEYKWRIGVSGSHGKSTTTAMLDAIFAHSGAMPTTLSGADLPIGDPMRLGSSDLLIYEACEYRDSFLRFTPTVSIGLNLDLDHTDYFPDIASLRESFLRAFNRAEELVILSGDDPNFKKIIPKISTKVITFGRSKGNTYRYDITGFCEGNFAFDLYKFENKIGSFKLHLPGAFNLHNATAAIATATELGIDIDLIHEAVSAFRGIPRRLELIGRVFGRDVYYDYAHHPTEIGASITALRGLNCGEITVVFKPHTYSRTKSLWNEMCRSLSLADHVVLTDIYAAREEPIPGITSENLARDIGESAAYVKDNNAAEYIMKNTKGAIVLMGAGDLTEIKNQLIR